MDMCTAIEENILDKFKLVSEIGHITINGQIKFIKDGKVVVKIDNDCVSQAIKTPPNTQYNIIFQLNSLPFQVQHSAIDFMQRHQLFSQLINNSEYNTTSFKSQSLEIEVDTTAMNT